MQHPKPNRTILGKKKKEMFFFEKKNQKTFYCLGTP